MPRSKAVATGIYRLPSGKLRIEFSTGKKREGRYEIYREVFDGSVEEAKRRRAKLIAEHAEGRLKVPEKGITLGRYFEKFFEYNVQRARSGKITQSTVDFYERSIRQYFAGSWGRPLAKVTAKEIIDILAGIKAAGRSADYMLSIFRALRAAWLAARPLKVIPPDILPDVAAVMPPVTKKKRTVLQPAEVLQLLRAAEDDPITHGIMVCLITTAMRINECFGLRETDADPDNLLITVEQQVLKKRKPDGSRFGPHKTYKHIGPRYIRMTRMFADELPRIRAAVAEMRLKAGTAWQDYRLLFPTSVGTPFSYSRWERDRYIPLFAAAGIPYVSPHGLRRSVTTFLLSQGVPLPTVMEICGWTEVKTAMSYTHLLVSAQNEAMNTLDRAYGTTIKKARKGKGAI